jgi:hypothetical protein
MTHTKGNIVEIVCIVDKSSSMNSRQDEVIDAFNEFIDEQKKVEGDAVVSLTLFNGTVTKLHERIKLEDTPKLTRGTYNVGGMTALNDAIGQTIADIPADAKHVIVLIQTDGEENASREHNTAGIRDLIKEKEALGWNFEFIGAGPEGFASARTYGMASGNTHSISNDAHGYASMKGIIGASTMSVRSMAGHTPAPEDQKDDKKDLTDVTV